MADENVCGTARGASFNAVFFIALALVAGIGTWGLVSPDSMTGAAARLHRLLPAGHQLVLAAPLHGLPAALGLSRLRPPTAACVSGATTSGPSFATASWDRDAVRRGHGGGSALLGGRRAHLPLQEPARHGGGDAGGGAPVDGHHEPALGPCTAWSIYGGVRARHRLLHVQEGAALAHLDAPEVAVPRTGGAARAHRRRRARTCSRWCSGSPAR